MRLLENEQDALLYLNQIVTKFWQEIVKDELPAPHKLIGEVVVPLSREELAIPTLQIDDAEGDKIANFVEDSKRGIQRTVALALAMVIENYMSAHDIWKYFGKLFEITLTETTSDIEIVYPEWARVE